MDDTGDRILPRWMLEELVAELRLAAEQPDPALRQIDALRAVMDVVMAADVDNALLEPFREISRDIIYAYLKRKHGGRVLRRKRHGGRDLDGQALVDELWTLAKGAAAVTVLKERGDTVTASIKFVSKEMKLDRAELKRFYDDLNRKDRTIPYARLLYCLSLGVARRAFALTTPVV
jgi:hypothetical protein